MGFNKTPVLTSGKQGHSGVGNTLQTLYHPRLTEDGDSYLLTRTEKEQSFP